MGLYEISNLLEFIDEGRVVPVVGPGLLRLNLDGREVMLHRYLAERLAADLGVADRLRPDSTLADVLDHYIERGGQRREIYPAIKIILNSPLPVPTPLAQLAGIGKLKLFITTTYDSLLVDALNQARFGGKPKTEQVAYSPSRIQDLPAGLDKLERPVVFHLLGCRSAAPTYAVTEEDVLEFVHSLQAAETSLPRLLDEIRSRHLLILGCGFPDWLQRFFLRAMRGERLSRASEGQSGQLLIDGPGRADPGLSLFLRRHGAGVEVHEGVDPVEFVDRLYKRWLEANQGACPAEIPDSEPDETSMRMRPGAIFLSYAQEDLRAVQAMCEALEAKGLDVWFDKRRLKPGDRWEREIGNNIRQCSAFLPFISENTQRRTEGYFRREWSLAADRCQYLSERKKFLFPVLLDGILLKDVDAPRPFLDSHVEICRDGVPSDDLTRELVRVYRDAQKT